MQTKFDEELIMRLHARGWHYLLCYPKSKKPIGMDWNSAPRLSLEEIKQGILKNKNNLGLLGNCLIDDQYYLCCIDYDLKKTATEKEIGEMHAKLDELFPGWRNFPRVESGSCNGSGHLYALSPEPLKGGYLAKKKLWSIAIQGSKSNLIQPGSVHPKTGKLYTVANPLSDFPIIDTFGLELEKDEAKNEMPTLDFQFETVDLVSSRIPAKIVDLIVSGKGGTGDGSTDLFNSIKDLLRHKFTDNQVCSVFLDRNNFLGEVAYRHAQTDSMGGALRWLYLYNVKKAKNDIDAAQDFSVVDNDNDTGLDLETNQFGKPKQNLINTLKVLESISPNIFLKNEFSLKRTHGIDAPWGYKKGDEVNDDTVVCILRYVAETFHFEPKKEFIFDSIANISHKNRFHPVKKYFDGLQWDGKNRIDTWLKDYAHAKGNSIYLRAISRKVLCAMIARIYKPGTKFDTALILEGPNQGEGKSRMIQALASKEWYGTVRFDMAHRDFVLALQGCLITEISELSGLGKRDSSFIKAILSEESDRIRLMYGHFFETLHRQGIFIGTTNHFQYLNDETGNRRMWPIRVGKKIDVDGIKNVRDQLFAEAKVVWEAGEKLYLDRGIEKLARKEQIDRVVEDTWEDIFATTFAEKPYFLELPFLTSDLFKNGGPLEKFPDSKHNTGRARQVLRKMGFISKVFRGPLRRTNHWFSPGFRPEKSMSALPPIVGLTENL